MGSPAKGKFTCRSPSFYVKSPQTIAGA